MAKKKRVIVAMSSGVDSSVAAVLLKKQGYDVVGVFMHFWKEPASSADGPNQSELVENKCCSLEAQEDARKVAQILNIPLYTANVAKEFKKEVVDYYLNELKSGRTPNPCVACNKHIKFNFLFKKMLEMKADFIASGHYAQVRESRNQKSKSKKQVYRLFQGKDSKKDQSYFLYNLNQKQLKRIIFPIGKYKKPEIRKIARKANLPIFNKDESQGICFAPEKYPTDFIKRNLKMKKGKTMDTDGNIIGTHEGLAIYTIGQRRGINIGGGGPYYVVDKDIKKDLLIVTNKEKEAKLYKKEVTVENVNWVVKNPARNAAQSVAGGTKFPLKTNMKIRYRKPAVRAIIKSKKGNKYRIEFKELQKAVTPGQSAVFYSNKGEILGGGIIAG
ncbi:MAG TPA: tRNA 2-thiouridine(34) synthase MnmA [Candidatus Moranbacteria bacterium]|nr:tRNA 2-thiouridine(34) synthase MnmA [Candidatus Moranbacteria bacterium]